MLPSNPFAQGQEDARRATIVLVDEEPLSQDCLAEALRGAFPTMNVLAASRIEDCPAHDGSPAVLLVWKLRPQADEPQVLARIAARAAQACPDAPLVAICDFADDVHIGEAIAAGIQGVVPVTASFRIAVAALQLVMAGGTYYPYPPNGPPHLQDGMAVHGLNLARPMPNGSACPFPSAGLVSGAIRAYEANGAAVTFTARESDVLAALQMGRSNKWIAHHLNLSENTIKVHIRRIMAKLHATNRTEAVILSQGLVLSQEARHGAPQEPAPLENTVR